MKITYRSWPENSQEHTGAIHFLLSKKLAEKIVKTWQRYVNLSSFREVFASQTASWLVSGAETSTTRSFSALSIDWYRFHCDQLSNEWGDASNCTTYIYIYILGCTVWNLLLKNIDGYSKNIGIPCENKPGKVIAWSDKFWLERSVNLCKQFFAKNSPKVHIGPNCIRA